MIKHGKVVHGYLSFSLNDVTPDNARFFNLPDDTGAIVDRHPTSSANQFVSEVHGNPAGKDMLLLVWSKDNASYHTVRAGSTNQNG